MVVIMIVIMIVIMRTEAVVTRVIADGLFQLCNSTELSH